MLEQVKEYPKETESRSVIRFQDCDPLRHLNNAKYFDYFFNAREDQTTQLYGVRPGDIFQRYKAGWVVYQHQIAYVRPAMVGEWVRIMSRIIFFNEDTVVVEYYMTDDSKANLKTVLWTSLKYVEVSSGKKRKHHEEIMTYLDKISIHGLDFSQMDINSRIKEIKEYLKKQYS
ncbi:acyl-CoA thioesterase [Flexithrix dorotheae]|uniref:acyl-CoA thioesterase n=1 Tax=Flexithrix dorotheae TaxID=70993 RepID=UPI00036EE4BA|nr:acyl-CoA thioesterase [Flexithrix dorotheae]